MHLFETPLRTSRTLVWAGLVLLLAAGCGDDGPTATAQPRIENAFPNLTFNAVTDIQAPPDGSSRLFVLERDGRIVVFESDSATEQKRTFLDIRSQVDTRGEGGLLGLAFHPEYAQNGRFFVYYTTSQNGPFRSVVSRFTVSASNSNSADPGSEQVVLTVEQPFSNHNAGQLQFGPDGYLYVGLGDGGSGGDPQENGQDPTTLLGSMLRLDVDLDDSGPEPDCGSGAYEIPSENPFVDAADGRCDEIYAYGFRNPYRYSFGPEGRLWVADVGQASWEEVDWVEADKNYGWDVMEGRHCFEPSSNCDTSGLEPPIFEYSHSVGNSITGGYVYEGSCGYIEGRYIYGDYGSGRIWALSYDASGAMSNELLINSSLDLTTFGVGPEDGLYFAGLSDDALYQFVCSALPVELSAFDAEIDGNTARLGWTTASEHNNAGFEVQHRTGEDDWHELGFVESKAAGGTTTEPKTYRFVASDLPVGTHRFRLKQVDLDGAATLTRPVAVDIPMQEALRLDTPTPNPASDQVTLSFAVREAVRATVGIYNMLGQQIKTLYDGTPTAAERRRLHFDASGLPSGTYFLRLRAGDQTRTRRLTVVR